MTKSNNNEYKMKDIEKDVDGLKADVKRILENHLPHIQNSVTELRGEISNLSSKVTTAVSVNIVLIIAGVVGVILLIR